MVNGISAPGSTTALGSHNNPECQINSVAQTWAILGRAGDPQRCRQAMQELRLTPRLPQTWTTFKIHYRHRQTPYHLTLTRLAAGLPASSQISLDGQDLAGKTIPLQDDRRDHAVEMKIR